MDKQSAESPMHDQDFCTECGAALDEFCFDKDAENLEKLKKNRERCEKSGKAKGEFCSKLFIAEPVDPDLLDEEE